MARGPLRYPVPLVFLYPAVLLSGATALAYEIVWTRKLSLVLGSATSAAAAVLGAFMLGLAAGAVVVGWRADESRRPLRWYGVLELGIGVYALAFDPILEIVTGWFPGSPWLASFALLALPAALMGGTLPVLARAGADTIRSGTGAFGSLYGVNTLGAVAGALLTVFFCMEAWGLTGTVRVAAAINIALGVLFWVGGMMAGHRERYAAEEPGSSPSSSWTGDAGPVVVAAFFLAGFAALALEMAWVRVLVWFLEGFTLAFGLMLATYLLGLGAGALGGTFLALLSGNPRRLLARILLVEAVLAVATFLFVGPIGGGLEAMRGRYVEASGIDTAYSFGLFWGALAIIFPATFCAGMLMPVVARVALANREAIGRHSGVVYAASTAGAVIAPAAAAFWLLPNFGVGGTIAAMGAVLLAAGTLLAVTRGLREWIFAGAAAVLFVAACMAGRFGEPLILRSHVFGEAKLPRRLLTSIPGQLGDVSVVEELKDGARRLYVDGFSAAETGPQYGYMRMQGHLPVLLHPAPERVLVIAFGTGTTAGAAAVHDEVERVVCVEIEPAVYDVASYFEAQNRGVLGMDKTERVVADGREYVRRGGTFDVITLEPLMPYTPGAVYLYTQEFYAEARGALAKDGILCQWIPPQGVSNADLKRLVASMAAEFEHVSLWYFRHAVLVLGSAAPHRVERDGFLRRASRDAVQEDLRIAAVGGPAHLLGAHVCGGDALRAALGDAKPMVDDRTDLEFRPLPRRMGKLSMTYHAENLEWIASIHQNEVEWMANTLATAPLALESTGAVLRTLALEWRNRVEGGPVVPAQPLLDIVEKDRFSLFALAEGQRRLYGELMERGNAEEAAQLTWAPDRSAAYLHLADRTDGAQRLYYLTLAVRQNALLDPADPALSAARLDELAKSLEGDEARFVSNRARALRGEPLEEGAEAVPDVALPDLKAALEAGDAHKARMVLEQARQADMEGLVDDQAWDWFQASEDPKAAALLLHEIGSKMTLRAALHLARKADEAELAVLAPIFCARYPGIKKWEDLCKHPLAEVRVAAADAAKGTGTREHLPVLAEMCRDPEESVRLSAFLSFRDIEPAADGAGFDYRKPETDALARLDQIARRQ